MEGRQRRPKMIRIWKTIVLEGAGGRFQPVVIFLSPGKPTITRNWKFAFWKLKKKDFQNKPKLRKKKNRQKKSYSLFLWRVRVSSFRWTENWNKTLADFVTDEKVRAVGLKFRQLVLYLCWRSDCHICLNSFLLRLKEYKMYEGKNPLMMSLNSRLWEWRGFCTSSPGNWNIACITRHFRLYDLYWRPNTLSKTCTVSGRRTKLFRNAVKISVFQRIQLHLPMKDFWPTLFN